MTSVTGFSLGSSDVKIPLRTLLSTKNRSALNIVEWILVGVAFRYSKHSEGRMRVTDHEKWCDRPWGVPGLTRSTWFTLTKCLGRGEEGCSSLSQSATRRNDLLGSWLRLPCPCDFVSVSLFLKAARESRRWGQ